MERLPPGRYGFTELANRAKDPSLSFAAANSSFFALRHPDPMKGGHAKMKEAGDVAPASSNQTCNAGLPA
ncbi:MAG: hypothetical protein ACK4P4_12230, partial [Allorhizobium sp.]